MNLHIMRAGPAQLGSLTPLFDGYRQFYGQAPDSDSASRFLRERLERNESVIYLASQENHAVGFTQLYPSFSSVAMQRLWILNDLFVVSEARGRGVGQALLGATAKFAKEAGAKGLYLTTAIDNLSAQRLYERTGWQRDQAFYTYTLEV